MQNPHSLSRCGGNVLDEELACVWGWLKVVKPALAIFEEFLGSCRSDLGFRVGLFQDFTNSLACSNGTVEAGASVVLAPAHPFGAHSFCWRFERVL